jgi:hypothetical protein
LKVRYREGLAIHLDPSEGVVAEEGLTEDAGVRLCFWCFVIGSKPEYPTNEEVVNLTNSRDRSNTGKCKVDTRPACGSVLGPDWATVRFK